MHSVKSNEACVSQAVLNLGYFINRAKIHSSLILSPFNVDEL